MKITSANQILKMVFESLKNLEIKMKKLTRKIIKTTMTKQKAKLSEKDLWDEVLLIPNFLFEYIRSKIIFLNTSF